MGTVSEFGGLEIVCNRCGSHLGPGNSGVSKDEDIALPEIFHTQPIHQNLKLLGITCLNREIG